MASDPSFKKLSLQLMHLCVRLSRHPFGAAKHIMSTGVLASGLLPASFGTVVCAARLLNH